MKSGLLSAAVLPFAFAIACGTTSPAPFVQPVAPAVAPRTNVAPVVSSPLPTAPRPSATAVSLTAAEKGALQEFAEAHDRINGEWDKIHGGLGGGGVGPAEGGPHARVVGWIGNLGGPARRGVERLPLSRIRRVWAIGREV